MPELTFATADLTTFARLDELGLVALPNRGWVDGWRVGPGVGVEVST